MKVSLLKAVVAFAGLVVAMPALAGGIKADPGVFDPNNTKTVSASWETKQGLPDAGKSDHALVLIKATDTSTFSAAGADIKGVEGDAAGTTLGFDIRDDSYSSGGSPRFNLDASDGFHFVGGAGNGTVSPAFADSRGVLWRRVTFNLQNPAQAFPVVNPAATINSLSVIVDEDTRPAASGAVIIDNINVNGTFIGKPGNAK